MSKEAAFLGGLILMMAFACTPAHNNMNSTLWMQSSPEYQALTQTIYKAASDHLDTALTDTRWTAALEQKGPFEHLPPAVILDIDGTVLDNSPYQGQLIADRATFNPDNWDDWIGHAQANPVQGAAGFIREAQRRGVAVIFITNRTCKARSDQGTTCPQEQDTLINLKRAGFAEETSPDEILLRNEMAGWSSEKQSRRRHVAASYRVLMLFGDDLGDFIPNVKTGIGPDERLGLARQHQGRWGTQWFMLPNPTYGSWLSILPAPHHKLVKGWR
jgi:acid phosphatase